VELVGIVQLEVVFLESGLYSDYYCFILRGDVAQRRGVSDL